MDANDSKPKRFRKISGSICAPLGFKAAAVFCDIKKLGTGKGSEKGQKRDLALIVSNVPAAVAGMFTRNQVCAAPVKISAQRATKKSARAIVVNSGNANACTGRQGMKDAIEMTRLAARAVAAVSDRRKNSIRATVEDRRYSIKAEDILVCSTGRIGASMPMKNVARGIRECAPLLARSAKNARETAEAIMTSDTRRKEVAVEFKMGKSTVRIGGICKGAGMIQPGMIAAESVATGLRPGATAHSAVATGQAAAQSAVTARRATMRSAVAAKHATMLAFIATDAEIGSELLKRALEVAVGQSFNRITIDGDMSTNDSVIALANGLAQNKPLQRRESKEFQIFQEALNFVTLELAKMIVRDGEGVTRFVTLHVRGARDARDAETAARAIANSALVKTSWCGGDPNWGRILCALGYSGAQMNESITDIGYSRPDNRTIVYGFRRGKPAPVEFSRLAKITSAPEFDVHVDLHSGQGQCAIYASDLTENYVAFNKGDVSDPKSLGG